MTKKRLKKNTNASEEMKNQLARALADYSNLQKKIEEERKSMYKFVSVSFVMKLLPVIDNLKSAQNHINDGGIAIIVNQLESLIKEEGFEEMKVSIGEDFNENLHEVVDVVETNDQKLNNKILEIILSGWKYKDGTVVRHAKVKVNKFKSSDKKEGERRENE